MILAIFALLSFAVACGGTETIVEDYDDNNESPVQQLEQNAQGITKTDMEQFVADILSGVLQVSRTKDVAVYEDGVCLKKIGEKSPFVLDSGIFVFNDMIFYEDGTCRMCYGNFDCKCEDDCHSWLYTKITWSCDMDTRTFTTTSERLAKNEKYINATTTFQLIAYDKENKICQLRGLMPTNVNKNWEWEYVNVPIADAAKRAEMEKAFVDEDSVPCGKLVGYNLPYTPAF